MRWVLLQNDLDWQQMDRSHDHPPTSLCARSGFALAGHVRPSGREHQPPPGRQRCRDPWRGALAARGGLRGRRHPSPRPRLAAGPPSWSRAAVTPGPRWRPRGCSTGRRSPTPEPPTMTRCRSWSTRGLEVVVTDGNRRRATAVTVGRPILSPTLAAGEPHDRPPPISSAALKPRASPPTPMRPGSPRAATERARGLHDPKSRPANAFDRVERTAWKLRGSRPHRGVGYRRVPRAGRGHRGLGAALRRWICAVKAVDVIRHPGR